MMNYIAHHGIKGQRWGVRRYQNEDGTLTTAGKGRYIKEVPKNSSPLELRKLRKALEANSFGSKQRVDRAKSAAVLKDKINNLERRNRYSKAEKLKKTYNSLVSDLDPKEIKFGENYVKINLARYGTRTARSNVAFNLTTNLLSSNAGLQGTMTGGAIRNYKANRKMAKEIEENNRLSREFKAARKERRQNS